MILGTLKWLAILAMILAFLFQMIILISAFTGGIENRILLMGVVVMSPWVLGTAAVSLLLLNLETEQNRWTPRLQTVCTVAMLSQLMLFVLG